MKNNISRYSEKLRVFQNKIVNVGWRIESPEAGSQCGTRATVLQSLKLQLDSSILRAPWQSRPPLNWAITIPKIDSAVNRYLTSGVCQRKGKHVPWPNTGRQNGTRAARYHSRLYKYKFNPRPAFYDRDIALQRNVCLVLIAVPAHPGTACTYLRCGREWYGPSIPNLVRGKLRQRWNLIFFARIIRGKNARNKSLESFLFFLFLVDNNTNPSVSLHFVEYHASLSNFNYSIKEKKFYKRNFFCLRHQLYNLWLDTRRIFLFFRFHD